MIDILFSLKHHDHFYRVIILYANRKFRRLKGTPILQKKASRAYITQTIRNKKEAKKQ